MKPKRKKIPAALRELLLSRGRHGCFAHRLSWYQRVERDEAASKKAPPLDVHHLRYVSAGGDDSIENLVPLCPLCHRCIHESGTIGPLELSPENIRKAWDTWVSFGSYVPSRQSIGTQPMVTSVEVDLRTYHLMPTFLIGRDITYAEARSKILESTVGVLSRVDPHFPFPSDIVRPESWSMSTDAGIAASWQLTSAHEAFSLGGTIQLTAPAIMVLTRQRFPVFEGTDEQRTI